MDPDIPDLGLAAASCELPVEVPWFVGRAIAAGENELTALPDIASSIAIGFLTPSAQVQPRYADVRERENGRG